MYSDSMLDLQSEAGRQIERIAIKAPALSSAQDTYLRVASIVRMVDKAESKLIRALHTIEQTHAELVQFPAEPV